MERIKIHDKYFKKYINAEDIKIRIEVLGKVLDKEYANAENPPIFLSILTGSFIFAADLIREISFDVEISFIKLSSYEGTASTGKVSQVMGLTRSIEGRDVIIVEDIVETGNTMEELIEILKEKGAASVRICTLFFKPNRFHKDFHIDYPLFTIPDDFIVGYGLDYNQLGREYKDIFILDEE